mmetsp:Transcript_40616/g.56454  ORF Transcript_40616/g.56454 Transcript_40616/m.56454 type:complete len:137 (+) Transcript_40616:340-750(+)
MNKTVVKVPKLTETNYDTWTEMMSYLFDSNGGHKYINELIPIADIEEQAEREIFTNTAMLIVAHVHSDLQNLIRSDRSDPITLVTPTHSGANWKTTSTLKPSPIDTPSKLCFTRWSWTILNQLKRLSYGSNPLQRS